MDLTVSFIQSVISILLLLLFWLIQSILILYVTRKYIFPVFLKNRFIEWVIVQPSVAVHELSHLFAAIFTGSYVTESFISSRAGRVTTLSSESIGGWISRAIAAFAPSFQTLLLLILIIIVFPNALPEFSIHSIFEYKESYNEIVEGILFGLGIFFEIILNIFQSVTPLSIAAFVLVLYLLAILSMTATPSEEDWKAGLQIILSPIPFLSMLVTFILIYVILSYFGIGLIVPIACALIINFLISVMGLAVLLLFSRLLTLKF
jgi:phage shock protein PspC (stress-responsive transcriptional regulator)